MVLLPLIVFALFVFALVDIILRRDDQVKHLPKLANFHSYKSLRHFYQVTTYLSW